uniref:Uncharacterized protein n=1 Tax=Noctiluca scintillans TaxID=2966 RepID=A0A7S1B0P9_NOCSC|mmetsp:Transcript_7822/g.21465  ORF Transcript_7822/g.21465 Transcript_7822/m.21465 type:complete len:416 (+) Transcript_7822:64-1311(+)
MASFPIVNLGVWFYVIFLIFLVLRFLASFPLFKSTIDNVNYCAVLFILLWLSLCYSFLAFVGQVAYFSMHGKFHWTMGLACSSLLSLIPMFWICTVHATLHNIQVKRGKGGARHEIVNQIIALPLVYATMAFGSVMASTNALANVGDEDFAAVAAVALPKAEICLWTADLYMAFALYQYGSLLFDIMTSKLQKDETAGGTSEVAAVVHLQIGAIEGVRPFAVLGFRVFFLVCIAEACWSFFILFLAGDTTATDFFGPVSHVFFPAGTIASLAVIYSMYTIVPVVHGFRPDVPNLSLKCETIVFVVSFAFAQEWVVDMMKGLYQLLSADGQQTMESIPVIGWLSTVDPLVFDVVFACILMWESLALAIMNLHAWPATESWYSVDKVEIGHQKEKTGLPLIDSFADFMNLASEKAPL